MKKKPKSHVVLLKERTKERILGKSQGHSSTPKTKIPPEPDVPHFVAQINHAQDKLISSGKWKAVKPDEPCEIPVSVETAKMAIQVLDELAMEDATAGLPPEALPEKLIAGIDPAFAVGGDVSILRIAKRPVEHHGTENDLARKVLARLPISKLDPNSEEAELARLQKSQLRIAKKKG